MSNTGTAQTGDGNEATTQECEGFLGRMKGYAEPYGVATADEDLAAFKKAFERNTRGGQTDIGGLARVEATLKESSELVEHGPGVCRSGTITAASLKQHVEGKETVTPEEFVNLMASGDEILAKLSRMIDVVEGAGKFKGNGRSAFWALQPFQCWKTIESELRSAMRDAKQGRRENGGDDASSSRSTSSDNDDEAAKKKREEKKKRHRAEALYDVIQKLGFDPVDFLQDAVGAAASGLVARGGASHADGPVDATAVAGAGSRTPQGQNDAAGRAPGGTLGGGTDTANGGQDVVGTTESKEFRRAKGENFGSKELWLKWMQVADVASIEAVGKILLAEKPLPSLLAFCNNNLDYFRYARAFFTLVFAPLTAGEFDELVHIFRTKEWDGIRECCILSARLKTMRRHYSAEIDTILEMLADGVWPQYEKQVQTRNGQLYFLWLEMVALFMVGRNDEHGYLGLCIWAYLALGSMRLVPLMAVLSRSTIKPLDQSPVTNKMNRDREDARQDKYIVGVSQAEMGGEDLVAARTPAADECLGSMRQRQGRQAIAYAERQFRVACMEGRATMPSADGGAGWVPQDGGHTPASYQAQFQGGTNGGRHSGAPQPHFGGRGHSGRGRGHGAAVGPAPVPGNAVADPFSGRMAPPLPPGCSNPPGVKGTLDVRGRCWKCGRPGHGFAYCQLPHHKFSASAPGLLIGLIASGLEPCP